MSKIKIEHLFLPNNMFVIYNIFFVGSISLISEYRKNIYFYVFFLLIIIAFLLGNKIGSIIKIKDNKQISFNLRTGKHLLYLYNIISIFSVIYLFNKLGMSIYDIVNKDRLMSVIAENTYNRYKNPEQTLDSVYLLLNAITLSGCFFSGAIYPLFVELDKPRKMIFFIPVISVALAGVLLAVKLGSLYGIFAFFSSYLSMKIQINKLNFSLPLKKLGTAFIVLLVFLMFLQFSRYNGQIEFYDVIRDKFGLYLFGSYSAFAVWLEQNVESVLLPADYGFGFNTFTGFLSLFGLVVKKSGTYDYVDIADGVETNVFTFYRGILDDFGLLGCLVFMFTLGVLIRIALNKMIHNSINAVFIFAVIYFFILFSFSISCLIYTTIIITLTLFFISISIVQRRGTIID